MWGSVMDETNKTIRIDDVDYNVDKMSEEAKKLLSTIQFIDQQLNQLQNEFAVSDTARIGYLNALQKELK
jgi:cell division protein ZapA (FtsZ GTPase activity inhibitor)